MNEEQRCPGCGKRIDTLLYKCTYTELGTITTTEINAETINNVFEVGCPMCGHPFSFDNTSNVQDFLNGLEGGD